jgi:enoyl-CoA hydratase/carnithine racemase
VLALASDFRVLGTSSRLAFLFTKVGLAGADMGAAYLLPRLIGAAKATELLMLGDTIDAVTADKYGLTTALVPDADVDGTARSLAERLADGPALAYGQTKALITRELDMSLAASLELDATTQALLMSSADHAEFHAAFTAKRRPRWQGR